MPADGLDLGGKVGPLTRGGWVAVAAGGAVLIYYLRNRQAAQNASAAAATGQPAAPVGTSGVLPLSNGASGNGTSPLPPAAAPVAYIDNTQWEQAAIREMLARNYDPSLVLQALGDYLAGNQLSSAEQAVVSSAVILVGPPPSPPSLIPGPPVTPNPPPVPVPTPTPTPTPQPWQPPFYPDRRPGTNPPPNVCPNGYAEIVLPDGAWSCMLISQFNAGVAPAGTTRLY